MTFECESAAATQLLSPRPLQPYWGRQALFQFISICLLTTLLYSALSSGNTPQATQPVPFLLELDEFLHDMVRRSNKFFDGDVELHLNSLNKRVQVWTLTAVLANLLSAFFVLIVCFFGWTLEHVKLRILIAVFAIASILLTLVTAPLLYSTPYRSDGTAIPIDAAVAALLIYICCLVTDVAGALDYPPRSRERTSYANFILAVDIPCIGVTAIFSTCALYISFPPAFVVGTVAALFVYYNLAFFLLSSYNWAKSPTGASMISKITGNTWLLIALGAALNGAIGTVVQIFKWPLYLDITGSLIVGAMSGLLPAVLSAALGVLILGVTTTPVALAYIGTAVLVSAAAVLLRRRGFMTRWLPTLLWGGFFLGPLSTILSVPVTVYLFGGVTFAGSDAWTLAFVTMGDTLLEAVVKGAIGWDALDKALASFMAYFIYRRIPDNLRTAYRSSN